MAKEFAKRFYKSKQWQSCRASFISARISIDGGLCQTCHERPGFIVHHKVWLTPENIDDPSIALNHDNLRYDCLICHNKEKEFESEEDKPRCRFAADGSVLPP